MIHIDEKRECSGCTACACSCPQGCISMQKDEEGFKYPVVDESRCTGCGLCEKVCPVLTGQAIGDAETESHGARAFGGWHSDGKIRYDSSSGGVFTLLAEHIINEGGIVFGCALDDGMRAVHIGVETVGELYHLRGSKYVQSDIGDTYTRVKDAVSSGRKVLFVGTPCQAAGLYSYMGKRTYDRLYIVDFICHGVPSPMVFDGYIRDMERTNGSRMMSFRFRNKDHGWNQTGLHMGTFAEFENKKKVRKFPAFMDSYMNGFLDSISLRPYCYSCRFKGLPREYSDFTLGDFWGVNRVDRSLNDKKGTSLVLVHTSHGMELWNRVSDRFCGKEVDVDAAISRNVSLTKCAKKNPRRDRFFSQLKGRGFRYVKTRYMSGVIWAWHRSEKLIKFAMVGCSNALINLAIYYLLHGLLKVNYLIAYTIGFLVSVCNAFYWNNGYVFKDKRESNPIAAFIKLVMSYGASFLLSVLLMGIMVELLRIPTIIAPILKMAVTIPLNFIMNKVWVFKDRRE